MFFITSVGASPPDPSRSATAPACQRLLASTTMLLSRRYILFVFFCSAFPAVHVSVQLRAAAWPLKVRLRDALLRIVSALLGFGSVMLAAAVALQYLELSAAAARRRGEKSSNPASDPVVLSCVHEDSGAGQTSSRTNTSTAAIVTTMAARENSLHLLPPSHFVFSETHV